jgi:peptidoglycan/LPS O-acetylase OafA/YrhL
MPDGNGTGTRMPKLWQGASHMIHRLFARVRTVMGFAACGIVVLCLMEPSNNALTRSIRAVMLVGFGAIMVIPVVAILLLVKNSGGDDDGSGGCDGG